MFGSLIEIFIGIFEKMDTNLKISLFPFCETGKRRLPLQDAEGEKLSFVCDVLIAGLNEFG